MGISASTISMFIGLISAIVAVFTIIKIIVRDKNAENITIRKSTGETLTVSKTYNREQSKRLLEFMK